MQSRPHTRSGWVDVLEDSDIFWIHWSPVLVCIRRQAKREINSCILAPRGSHPRKTCSVFSFYLQPCLLWVPHAAHLFAAHRLRTLIPLRSGLFRAENDESATKTSFLAVGITAGELIFCFWVSPADVFHSHFLLTDRRTSQKPAVKFALSTGTGLGPTCQMDPNGAMNRYPGCQKCTAINVSKKIWLSSRGVIKKDKHW